LFATLSMQFIDRPMGTISPGEPTLAIAVFCWVVPSAPAACPNEKSTRAGGVTTLILVADGNDTCPAVSSASP
jgi:hypothetical protein